MASTLTLNAGYKLCVGKKTSFLTAGAYCARRGAFSVSHPLYVSRKKFVVVKAEKFEKITNKPESVDCKPANVREVVLTFLEKAVDTVKQPAVAAAIILSILLSSPDQALAANSGGRVGGRSFSSRSYSAPQSQTYSAPTYISPGYSAPYFAPSPFGFSPFSFGPTVVVGGGGFGSFFGLLFFGGILIFIVNALTGFLSNEGDDMYATETTSVVRLQIGLLGIARDLQKDLDRIAQRADTSSPDGLHFILTETTLSLLRNPNYCVYGHSTTEVKNSMEEGEAIFNRISLEERGKLKEETLVNVNDVQRKSSGSNSSDNLSSEFIVVTIVAAAEGSFKLPQIKSSSDLREALTVLGSIPSDQLQAIEILWTPQAEGDTLTSQELMVDFPSLRSL